MSGPAIFARRPAPVQVSYLGYPGTMGADYIDYLIADTVLVPSSHQAFYAEKLVYMPDCYQVNDLKRVISQKSMTRVEVGLPEEATIFCCFNNNHKIVPDVFGSWMRILGKVENSILWLLEDNASVVVNLKKEAHRETSVRRASFLRGGWHCQSTLRDTGWLICSSIPCPTTRTRPRAIHCGRECLC